MTIAELKDMLNDYNDSDEVLIKPHNSTYVESISHTQGMNINTFWSDDDHNAVIIICEEQVGSI